MRKIKLFIASSLDCYISREDGSIDWLFTDDDYGYLEFYNSIDTVLMGRKPTIKLWNLNSIHSGVKSAMYSARIALPRKKIKM
jgi:hypothetical protein